MESTVSASSGAMVWQTLVLVGVILIAYAALKYYTTDKADV